MVEKQPRLDSGAVGLSFHDVIIVHALMREANKVIADGQKVAAAKE
jgi:hypothetical protein